jgi:hypothetical protein
MFVTGAHPHYHTLDPAHSHLHRMRMIPRSRTLLLALAALAAFSSRASAQAASASPAARDMVIYNARVFLADSANTFVQALSARNTRGL